MTNTALSAAVCNAGGLGAVALGALDAEAGRAEIRALRAATDTAFNANVFCHRAPERDFEKEQRWLERLAPTFERLAGAPPRELRAPYRSFLEDPAMLAMLVEERPAVVSFHFGPPSADAIQALKNAGCVLLGCATSLAEAEQLARAGMDAVIAQGWEAGGHRGSFEPEIADDRLGTLALTRALVRRSSLPVIAAGGIMDGAGIAAALALGAEAAQLGTAFIACPESSADEAHRAALFAPGAEHTTMTSFLSGRPARSLANALTALETPEDRARVPAYPVAYDAIKALVPFARAAGATGLLVQLAGQGAPLARRLPAAALIAELETETKRALARHSEV